MEFSFKVATSWIEKLAKVYSNYTQGKSSRIDEIADELMVVPQELAPIYIEPDIQPFNPADDLGGQEGIFRKPLFSYLDTFIKRNLEPDDGRRHLFILADAGMGKTSSLAMMMFGQINKLWPQNQKIIAFKLGPETLERIQGITGRGRTILLLDALDEDKEAYARIKPRISELLTASRGFFRVIITCRTQFFPKSEDRAFLRQDKIKIRGFECPVSYLSIFNHVQVEKFLYKKIKKNWYEKLLFIESRKIKKAKSLIEKMNDLKFRPMLLSYIDVLLTDYKTGNNSYNIYEILVEKWLDRECRTHSLSKNQLKLACIFISRYLTRKRSRSLTLEELFDLISDCPQIEHLPAVEVSGRSLLNKTSEGSFRFSHHSFQEFFVALSIRVGQPLKTHLKSDLVADFLRLGGLKGIDINGADFRNIDFHGIALTRSNMANVDLRESNLQGADLDGATLTSSKLNNADLRGCNLKKVVLSDSNLERANLSGSDLSGAKLSGANIEDTDLSYTFFERTDLKNVQLRNANLRKSKIVSAIFDGNDITGINLEGSTLEKTSFKGTILDESNLCNTTIKKTNFDMSSLKKAQLVHAQLVENNFRWTNMEKANLEEANVKKSNFEGVNLAHAKLHSLQNWEEIISFKNANLFGCEGAPIEFIQMAKQGGAIEVSGEEWEKLAKTQFSTAAFSV